MLQGMKGRSPGSPWSKGTLLMALQIVLITIGPSDDRLITPERGNWKPVSPSTSTILFATSWPLACVQPPKWSWPRNDPQVQNDPQIDPEMILTLKWSRPWNDPHFSSCRPRSDLQGIREWWLKMGLWIAFSFFVEMLQSSHFFLFFRSFKLKKTVCRATASFQSHSSRPI